MCNLRWLLLLLSLAIDDHMYCLQQRSALPPLLTSSCPDSSSWAAEPYIDFAVFSA